jgi:transcriptional regulator with XRE-family HTH domain
MNKRITEIRKYLKLNQAAFAERLGLKRTALSMIESGKNALTEKNIKLICLTFNVDETWLRTGKSEMFGASPYEKEFFEIFKDLVPEVQQALLRFAKELLKMQNKLRTGGGRKSTS